MCCVGWLCSGHSAGEDVYLVKKQDGLLQEANSVVTDCQRRLNTAFGKLTALVEGEVSSELAEVNVGVCKIKDLKAFAILCL